MLDPDGTQQERTTRGPKTYPSTYTDTTKDASATLSSLNSSITKGTPGANVDEANGLEDCQYSRRVMRSKGNQR